MTHKPVHLIIVSLILVFILSIGPTKSLAIAGFGTDATEAQQAINKAQDAINSAFGYMVEADLAGAEISDFVVSLNDAIEILTHAQAAFNASNFTSATELADDAKNAAELVGQQAQSRLLETRINAAIQALITISIFVVVVAVTYLLITRWREQKRKREQSLMQMEIHLPNQEDKGETDE